MWSCLQRIQGRRYNKLNKRVSKVIGGLKRKVIRLKNDNKELEEGCGCFGVED